MIAATKKPVQLQQKEPMKPLTTKDGILYNNHHIEVAKKGMIWAQILKSQQTRKDFQHSWLGSLYLSSLQMVALR